MFELDRAAWDLAYADVGADVVRLMQDDNNEAGYIDDDDENVPPSPRWAAQEKLLQAKRET